MTFVECRSSQCAVPVGGPLSSKAVCSCRPVCICLATCVANMRVYISTQTEVHGFAYMPARM